MSEEMAFAELYSSGVVTKAPEEVAAKLRAEGAIHLTGLPVWDDENRVVYFIGARMFGSGASHGEERGVMFGTYHYNGGILIMVLPGGETWALFPTRQRGLRELEAIAHEICPKGDDPNTFVPAGVGEQHIPWMMLGQRATDPYCDPWRGE